ncbi:MAG: VanZ family protein [Planctomycetota bacterium]|jgi:VanZ family protein|nr:VanZ family protein [Planctomycetota bacterium]MDP7251898.1 VanZ family protein [Planctomycetota bacterium]
MKIDRPNLRIRVLVCYWAMLFAFTTVPTTWFGKAAPAHGTDKLAHLLAYSLLAFLYLWARHEDCSRTDILKASLILLAYGAFDELHQPIVGRTCDLADFLADGLGICTGISARLIFAHLWKGEAGH